MNHNDVVSIDHVLGDEVSAQKGHALQGAFSFGQDRLPVRRVRILHIDGNEALLWCVEVRHEVERAALVGDQAVAGVELIEKFHHLPVLTLPKIPVEKAILRPSSLPHRNDLVAFVLGHAHAEAPLRMIRPLIHQTVLRLRRADDVEVRLLVEIGVLQRLSLGRLGVAAVVKPAAIGSPTGPGKLDPSNLILKHAPGVHVHHMPGRPIGARLRQAVGDTFPIVTDRPSRDGNSSVLRQGVRVQKNRLPCPFAILTPVVDGLILEPCFPRVEQAPLDELRQPVLVVVERFRQSCADRLPLRQTVEKRGRVSLLRLDPGPSLLRVDVLHPAKGIGNLGAMDHIHDIPGYGLGIVGTHDFSG